MVQRDLRQKNVIDQSLLTSIRLNEFCDSPFDVNTYWLKLITICLIFYIYTINPSTKV